MTCKRVESQLSAFLDGELSGYEMLEMRRHIEACPICAEEAEGIRRIKALVAQPEESAPAADFEQRLIAHVFSSKGVVPQKQSWRFSLNLVGVAVAATVLAFVVATRMGSSATSKPIPTDGSSITRDQIYYNATDPLGGPVPIMPVGFNGQ